MIDALLHKKGAVFELLCHDTNRILGKGPDRIKEVMDLGDENSKVNQQASSVGGGVFKLIAVIGILAAVVALTFQFRSQQPVEPAEEVAETSEQPSPETTQAEAEPKTDVKAPTDGDVAQDDAAVEPADAPAVTETLADTDMPAAINDAPEVAMPDVAPSDPAMPEITSGAESKLVAPASDVEEETTQPRSEPTPAEPGDQPALVRDAPEFDLVRVDQNGSAVIAGRAEPFSTVTITLNGRPLTEVKVGAEGTFVALLDMPEIARPEELRMVQNSVDGTMVASGASVLVMPREQQAPKLVVAGKEGISVLQDETRPEPVVRSVELSDTPAPELLDRLSLDTIAYDEEGEVVVGGRGAQDGFVRIYVDNQQVETQQVGESGQWKVVLNNVEEGLYTLRVDEIDESGAVTSRVESPFRRVTPEGDDLGSSVTIQPGFTLWRLAERKYGSGLEYVQIFEANRDLIKDPDLIYPGQVFELPE